MKFILIIIIFYMFLNPFLFADYEQLPGFPVSYEELTLVGTSRGVGVVNINDDPYLEIVISIHDYVWAIDHTGETIWEAYTPSEVQRTMSFADVTNDGYLEILQTSRTGWVYILDKDGNNIEGWPKYFGSGLPVSGYTASTVIAYDINSDGNKEIIWGDKDLHYQNYLYVVDIQGNSINDNFPFPVPNGVTVVPAIGDINKDGSPEIVFYDLYYLYAIDADGNILPGWPQQAYNGDAAFHFSTPVLADLTGDGYLEIIAPASNTGYTGVPTGIYVYKYDGSVLSGWPQDLPYYTKCSVAVGDVNQDGELEIIIGRKDLYSTGHLLYIFSKDGEIIMNSEFNSTGSIFGPIIIGNIDNNPDMEIIFDSSLTYYNIGYIQGINHDGSIIQNFPLRPRGCTFLNGSVFGDVNNDSFLDLVTFTLICNDSIYIYVHDLQKAYDPSEILWKTYQYDFQRLGQYHPPYSFDPPVNFSASVDSHGVNLTWEQPANERNYAYSIFRDDNLLARTPYTTFCDSLVQSYTTYQYYIKSVYEQGFSPPSEIIEVTTDSISADPEISIAFTSSAYPNPFSISTTISFTGKIQPNNLSEIKIYNIKGQLIRELKIQNLKLKINEVVWDGKDNQGMPVATGIYFYTIQAGETKANGKMLRMQ